MSQTNNKLTSTQIVGLQTDLSANLEFVPSNRIPFLSNLRMRGGEDKASSTTISWVDYSSQATGTTIKQEIQLSAGKATNAKIGDSAILKANEFVSIGDNVYKVSDVSTQQATFTKQKEDVSGKLIDDLSDSTTKLTLEEPIYLINENIEEGADLLGADYKKGVNFDNKTQIVREEISVSGTAMTLAMPSGGGIDPYDLELNSKFNTVLGKLEKALVNGVKFEDGTKRGMNGIRKYLDHGKIVNAKDKKGISMLDMIDELVTVCYARGGEINNGFYALMMSPTQNRNLSKVLLKQEVATTGETQLGAVAKFIITSQGTLPIIVNANMPETEILLIDFSSLRLKTLRPLIHEFMGKKGDSTQGLIVGEYSLEARNLHVQGKIINMDKSGVTPIEAV